MVRAVQGNIHHELSIQVCVLRELFRRNSALEGHYNKRDQVKLVGSASRMIDLGHS